MPGDGTTFRVFVSSTFGDLGVERDALQRHVFGDLERLCAEHGARFTAVDLRWGVNEEAALDQRTLPICLHEVDRCRDGSLRPRFLLLLGERYGWCPLPYELAADALADDERGELTAWYELDENAVPPVRRLRPRTGQWTDPVRWNDQEHRLRELLETMPDKAIVVDRSATEHEILRGPLQHPGRRDVHCFLRTIDGLPADERAGRFRDHDRAAEASGAALRDRLRRELPEADVHEVRAAWTAEGVGEDHVLELCDRVRAALTSDIERELEQLAARDPLEREIDAHQHFIEQRAAQFAGRGEALEAVARHIQASATTPLYVHGVSGVGKSAFMAHAALAARADAPGALVLARCVGATSSSVDPRLLLDGLTRELARAAQAPEPAVPASVEDATKTFLGQLANAARDRRVVLFLDAVDQLTGDAGAALSWLEGPLPAGAAAVISTLPSPWLDAALTADPRSAAIELQPLASDVADAILDAWLGDAGRTLTPLQRVLVRESVGERALPLHLRLCFAEAVRWPSTRAPEPLPRTVEGMVDAMLARLGDAREHGEVLVRKALGYLAAGRGGLAEDELRQVLSADAEVLADLRRRAPRSPVTAGIPPIVLQRLLYDLRPYLSDREAQGATLVGFFHRSIGEAIAARFAAGPQAVPLHAALARSFDAGGGPRRLAELPYQLTLAREWHRVVATLTDARFLVDKAARLDVTERAGRPRHFGGALLLQQDVDAALADLPLAFARERDVLAAIGGALRREAVTLTTDPELLVQQVGNRLRTSGHAEAVERLERSATPGPRLRLRTPMPEPEELADVVQAGSWIYGCAVGGHDDELVVIASEDPVVRVWNRRSGHVRELHGHTMYANHCAIARDGSVAVSASPDGTMRVWDPHTGRQRLQLEHGLPVWSCALTDDGNLILSGAEDGTLRLWSAATGEALQRIDAHDGSVGVCALDRSGRRAVSATRNGEVRVWSLQDGRLLAERRHGEFPVCALSPDGTHVVAGSRAGEVVLWEAATGAIVASLAAEGDQVHWCAFSRDGSLIAIASDDGSVHVYTVADGRLARTLGGHRLSASACAFGADANCLVSGDGTGLLRLWDLSRPGSTTGRGQVGNVWMGTLALNGDVLASAGQDGRVRLVDVATGDAIAALEGHGLWVTDCVADADGELLITAGEDGTARTWDLRARREARTPVAHDAPVKRCAISPHGSVGLSGTESGAVRLFSTRESGPPRGEEGHDGQVWCAAFSPDGSFAVTGGLRGDVRTWEPATGRCLTTEARHEGRVIACAITPDARLVVSGGEDCALIVGAPGDAPSAWRRLPGHTGSVEACATSPDGSVIVSGGGFATVVVSDLATGAARHVLKCSAGAAVRDVAVSPDGALVAAAATDARVWVWDIDSGEAVARLVLPAQPRWVGFHPRQPLMYFGGEGGHAHVAELAGVDYGPLVVTAHGGDARCPACGAPLPISEALLGRELVCPTAACRRRVRVNAFTLAATSP